MEVRTEEERTPNHDGGKHTEPNETTPLTEPEYVGGWGRALPGRAPHPPQRPTHASTLPARGSRPGITGQNSGVLGQECLTPLSSERRHSWSYLGDCG